MTTLQDKIFSITDTETTGKEQGVDEAIEIASVKWSLKDGFLALPESWFVKPNRPIHPSAMAIHHLTEEDIKDAPPLDEVAPKVIDFVQGTTLVAHNAAFDQSMLPFLPEQQYPWIDSLQIARHIWEKGTLNEDGHDLTSHTCQELRYWLKLKVDTMGLPAHRAAADILVAGAVFGCAVQKYLDMTQNDSYDDFVAFCNAPVLVKKMPFSKYKGQLLEEVPTDFYGWYLNKVHSGEMNMDKALLISIDLVLKARGINHLDLIKTKEPTAKNWTDIAKQKNDISKKFK